MFKKFSLNIYHYKNTIIPISSSIHPSDCMHRRINSPFYAYNYSLVPILLEVYQYKYIRSVFLRCYMALISVLALCPDTYFRAVAYILMFMNSLHNFTAILSTLYCETCILVWLRLVLKKQSYQYNMLQRLLTFASATNRYDWMTIIHLAFRRTIMSALWRIVNVERRKE